MSLSPRIAASCYRRDGWKCRHCNNRNGLHPHHFIYKSHQGTDTLDNLITLCAACHRGHHDGHLDIALIEKLPADLHVRFLRKGNWKPT